MNYCGIGSRNTPDEVLIQMHEVAFQLAKNGWTLRSGHADGADMAFELGAKAGKGNMEIYIPWRGFNGASDQCIWTKPTEEDEQIAAKFHPAWDKLSSAAKLLMVRNTYQLFGNDYQTRSEFVICWTPNGNGQGGTGQAIRMANHYGIPVFDLGKRGSDQRFVNYINAA